jgi:hypothetical protein
VWDCGALADRFCRLGERDVVGRCVIVHRDDRAVGRRPVNLALSAAGPEAATPVATGVVVGLAQAVFVLPLAVRPRDAGFDEVVGQGTAGGVFEVEDLATTGVELVAGIVDEADAAARPSRPRRCLQGVGRLLAAAGVALGRVDAVHGDGDAPTVDDGVDALAVDDPHKAGQGEPRALGSLLGECDGRLDQSGGVGRDRNDQGDERDERKAPECEAHHGV